MATFKKGQSFKNQRVHITSMFDQKQEGTGLTGKNISFCISNDTREPDDVITDPMLVYEPYKHPSGETRVRNTTAYSANQWEKIEKAANKDGDALVVIADLIKNNRGPGLIVNTNTLRTPEVPFNAEKHHANVFDARQAKKLARAEKEAKAKEDKELEVEEDLAL